MDQDAEMIVVYTTFPTEKDAQKVGGELVEEKLAACVNIFPRYDFHLSLARRHRKRKRDRNACQDKKGASSRKVLESARREASLFRSRPYCVRAAQRRRPLSRMARNQTAL